MFDLLFLYLLLSPLYSQTTPPIRRLISVKNRVADMNPLYMCRIQTHKAHKACKLSLAKFSFELKFQDRAECGNNASQNKLNGCAIFVN